MKHELRTTPNVLYEEVDHHPYQPYTCVASRLFLRAVLECKPAYQSIVLHAGLAPVVAIAVLGVTVQLPNPNIGFPMSAPYRRRA